MPIATKLIIGSQALTLTLIVCAQPGTQSTQPTQEELWVGDKTILLVNLIWVSRSMHLYVWVWVSHYISLSLPHLSLDRIDCIYTGNQTCVIIFRLGFELVSDSLCDILSGI